MPRKSNSKNIPNVNYKPWLVSIILFLSDIFSILASFFAAYLVRSLLAPFVGGEVNVNTLTPTVWVLFILLIGLFIINGLYPGGGRTGVVELKEVIKIVTICFVILGLVIFIFRFGTLFSRSVFIFAWFFSCIFISFSRVLVHNRGSLLAWWNQPVVIVGYKKDVDKVSALFQRARRMALKPSLLLILGKGFRPSKINGIPSLPNTTAIYTEIRDCGIRLAVFVAHSSELNVNQKQQLHYLGLTFPKLIYVMSESPLSSLSMNSLDLEGRPALQVQYNLLDPWSRRIKRLADLVLCFLSLVITFPLFLLFALLIRIDSPGPILYIQKRMGKNGRIFDLYKFRTMEINAEIKLERLLKSDKKVKEEYQKYHKIRNDPRITRMGQFLRKISMDEFPQLWNVIRGDMSLVGPRAYMPNELSQMGSSAILIHRVSPGMTGWWQVMGRHDVSFKERLRLDEYYISNFSLWMDFYILIKTIWVVIGGKGA
jgi:Undecaprenyl-phosphate galactose phosphotransferase WbaP